MFLEEISDKLKEHAVRFDLEQRAIEACKRCLQNLLTEEPEETRFHMRGLRIEDLQFEFQRHQLVFDGHRSWPHILSQVNVGRGEIEVFGRYYLETIEEGEASDDWFSWEQMRDEEGKLTEFSRVLE